MAPTNRAQRRASSAKYPANADAWEHDKTIKGIVLPAEGSGPDRMVDLELPDLMAYAERGDIPNVLAEFAVRVEWDPSAAPAELDPAERRTYHELMCSVIGCYLRRPNLLEQAGGDPEEAARMAKKIPPMQRIALWQRCMHVFSDADVEALIRAAQEEGGEATSVKSVTSLETFREGAASPAVPADGATAAGSP